MADVLAHLRAISGQQSKIRGLRSKLAILKEAAAKQEGATSELLLVRRIPAVYRQCLAECMRRYCSCITLLSGHLFVAALIVHGWSGVQLPVPHAAHALVRPPTLSRCCIPQHCEAPMCWEAVLHDPPIVYAGAVLSIASSIASEWQHLLILEDLHLVADM